MNIEFIFNRFNKYKRNDLVILVILWVIGLVTGIIFSFLFRKESSAVLMAAVTTEHRPYFALLVRIFPLVVITLAIHKRIVSLCYPLFLLEALCHGFCGMLPAFVFGSSAWLVRSLFLFSSCCVAVAMWWLLLRHLPGKHPNFFKDVKFVFMVICGISLIDIYVISPQLPNLLIHF